MSAYDNDLRVFRCGEQWWVFPDGHEFPTIVERYPDNAQDWQACQVNSLVATPIPGLSSTPDLAIAALIGDPR